MGRMTKSQRLALVRLWPYLRKHLGRLSVALLLAIPMAAVKVSPVPAVQYLTDKILVNKDPQALMLLPLGIVALFAFNFVVRFFHYYLIRSAGDRTIQAVRNDLYAHLLRLSLGYFNEAQGGKLLSKVINDVQQIVHAISSLIHLVREPITFLGLLGSIFWLNWRLALVILTVTPFVAFVLSNTGRHAKRYTARIYDRMGDLSAILSESFTGMRVIQAFRLEGLMRGRFMKANRDLTRTALKAARMEEMAHPGVEFFAGVAAALVFYFGGREVLNGKMTAGELVAFFTSFGLMLDPIRKFNELNIRFNQCAAAAENVFAILDVRPEIESKPGAALVKGFEREVSFDKVTFQYREGQPVLRNFDFILRKGEVVALVGASGAGKSTVLGLIPRFFDPSSGAVRMDGVDLREAHLDSLRAQVSLVTQEVFLFHDTVAANVKAGVHFASDEDVERALKAAQAWEYVQKLPQGIHTTIGDRGQKLSGGERQRLSIARAILKNAPILLLDEATSALDTENERLVQTALDELMVGRTAVVVAHRLSTIRKAHRILVMEKGEILEEGTHEELQKRSGAYARALALQGGFGV